MKTTKKDFAYFQERCNYWIDYLSAKEWSVHYDHRFVEGAYAQTHWNLSGAVATIQFSTDWDDMRKKTDEELDRLALHEVLHIIMAPLTAEAIDRFTTQNAVDTAEHRIIRQLEHLVRHSDNKL